MCATGYGIRRSKDLRARFRKFLNLTNERKNMSTKTLRKRIALVAVATLGAGVLSVTPAFANYAAGEFSWPTASGSLNTGVCASTNSNTYGLTVGTAVSGSLVTLEGDGLTANDDVYISVSGPAVVDSYTLAANATGVYADAGATVTATTVTDTTTAANDRLNLRLTGVGTVYVSLGVSATTAALDVITIKSVAACASGTYSTTYSSYETSDATDSTPGADSGFEAESTYTYVDEDTAYVSIIAKNAYNAVLPSGVFMASSNTGCLVDIATASPAIVATSSSMDSVQADGTNIYVAVEQETSGSAITCVVEVKYNGASIYKKSILITGDLATLTVSGVDVQLAGGSTKTDLFEVAAKDAAGNLLSQIYVEGEASKITSLVTAVTAGYTSNDGSGNVDNAASDTTPDGDGAVWTCAAKTGSTPMRLVAENNAGVDIYSNEFTAACGSTPYTYTASLDKAAYVPGDIATLTITAKDSTGAIVAKGSDIENGAGAPDIAGSQMTPITALVASETFDAAGKKTYTFTVGSTAGKYNMQVSLGWLGNTAVSVPYSVGSDGSVTNADVLKAIVSLIASINKQIAALQKALLKK